MTVDKINEQALEEGWGIFYTDMQDAVHNLYELQRVDEDAVFESDVEVCYHVVALAENDTNGLHAKALYWLHENSPNELHGSIRHMIGDETYLTLIKKLNIKL